MTQSENWRVEEEDEEDENQEVITIANDTSSFFNNQIMTCKHIWRDSFDDFLHLVRSFTISYMSGLVL